MDTFAFGVLHNKCLTFLLFKDIFMKLLLPPFLAVFFVVCSLASNRAHTHCKTLHAHTSIFISHSAQPFDPVFRPTLNHGC